MAAADDEEILQLEDEDDENSSRPQASTKITSTEDDQIKYSTPTSTSESTMMKSKRPMGEEADHENYPPKKKLSTPPAPAKISDSDFLVDRDELDKRLSPEKPNENQNPTLNSVAKISAPGGVAPSPRISIEELKKVSAMHTSGPIVLRSKGNSLHVPKLVSVDQQATNDYLSKGPWVQMLRDHELPPFGSQQLGCSISFILRRGYKYKIPMLVVNVKCIDARDNGASLIARDPSGEMSGILDGAAMQQYGEQLSAGCVLVLTGVTMFNPEKSHYLNISRASISSVIPSNTPLPADVPGDIESVGIDELYVSQREMESQIIASNLHSPAAQSPYRPNTASTYGYSPSSVSAPPPFEPPTLPRLPPNSKAAATRARKSGVATTPVLPPDHTLLVASPTKTPTKPVAAVQSPDTPQTPTTPKPSAHKKAADTSTAPGSSTLATPASVQPPPAPKLPAPTMPKFPPGPKPPALTAQSPLPPVTKPIPKQSIISAPVLTMPPPNPIVTAPPVPAVVKLVPPATKPPSTVTIPKGPVTPPLPAVKNASPMTTHSATTLPAPVPPPKPAPPTLSKPAPPTVAKNPVPNTTKPAANSYKPATTSKPSAPPPASTFVANVASPLLHKPNAHLRPLPVVQQQKALVQHAPIASTNAAPSSSTNSDDFGSDFGNEEEERDELEGVQPHEEDFEFAEFEAEEESPLSALAPPAQNTVATTTNVIADKDDDDDDDEFADPELDALLAQNPDILQGLCAKFPSFCEVSVFFHPPVHKHMEKHEQSEAKNNKRASKKLDVSATKDAKDFYGQFITKHWPEKVPILYSSSYNIQFLGLEKLHPFDSCKYKNVIKHLEDNHVLKEKDTIEVTKMPTHDELKLVHTQEYLDSLNSSYRVAMITEVALVAGFPNFLVWWKVLNPMLYATAGTIAAGFVAAQRGWAINVGGGFHHCCGYRGGGFCPFADLTLSIRYLRRYQPQFKRVMLIDLDAHQGNGHERDKLEAHDTDLFIVDMYNGSIYPGDEEAKSAIDVRVELRSRTTTEQYLESLGKALTRAANADFKPDIVYYNAGTDILDGDPLGNLKVSAEGVVRRDEMVFEFARGMGIPIVMALSGGYQKSNAAVIGDSIRNLKAKGFFDSLREATL